MKRQTIGNVTYACSNPEVAIIQQALCAKAHVYKNNGLEPIPCKFIYVDDNNHMENYCVNASILLPDTKATECLINDDYLNFEYFYTLHLNTPEVREYILVLVAGLMEKAYDYVMLFDCENNYNMGNIATVLLRFLQLNIGLLAYSANDIQMDTNTVYRPSIAPGYMMSNLESLKTYGYHQDNPTDTQSALFTHF